MIRIKLLIIFAWVFSSPLLAQLYAPEIKVQDANGVYVGSGSVGGAFGVQGAGIRFFNSGGQYNYLDIGRRNSEKLNIRVEDNHTYIDLIQDYDGNGGHHFYIRNKSFETSSASSNDVILQAHNGIVAVKPNGSVGIGTTKPSANYKLQVNGKIYYNGGGHLGSDIKLKKNISDYKGGLGIVNKMRPVKYELTSEADSLERINGQTKKDKVKVPKYVSVIAQELQEISPDLVGIYLDENQEETLSIDMTALTFVLVNAVKELSAQVQEQRQLIEALKQKK